MRYVTFVIGAAIALCVGCAQDTTQERSLQAERAYAEGDFPKAIRLYEKLLVEDGESSMTYMNLALSAYRATDLAYAQRCCEKALALAMDPAQANACRELQGMIAEASKDTTGAIRIYRGLLTAQDEALRTRIRSRLAWIYTSENRLESAFALLLAAGNERTPDGVTLYNLGKLCVREPFQLRSAALDYFRQAERLLPEGSRQLKDAKEMIARLEANLKRLQKLPPNAGDAKACAAAMKRSQEAQNKKRWASAEKEAKKATEADPSNFDAALAYARICVRNNKRTEAQKAFEAAIALKGASVEARLEAAKLAYQMKRYEDALTVLRPALVLQPKNITLADTMMRLLAAQNKQVDARAWGEYVLALNPQATKAYHDWVQKLPED